MKLTVKEVAAQIGETPAVVRNWVRDFKQLIPSEKGENNYNYYGEDALKVFQTIKRLHRDQGYSTKQIEAHLSGAVEIGATAAVIDPATAGEVAEMRTMMQTILDNQQQQQEFNRLLIRKLEERDRQLTEYISERREQKRIEASQKRRTPSLWQRLTGRDNS